MERIAAIIACMLVCCVVGAQQASDHLYVVIVNGGMNKLMNHERYWNDCAFLYRTLRHCYQLPKEHIAVLMSDGGDPVQDMLRDDATGFASSPSDLDGDGERDVWTAATLTSVDSTMTSLAQRLTGSDHLFLFMMDHGGSNDGWQSSYVWMWGSERLSDTALSAMLGRFRVATVCVVMGQCYSGGFIDNLAGPGRIVMTACRGDESSWNCWNKPYDEFVYRWTCAIAGANEEGIPVLADSDGDGMVTMAEAFDYAKSHDERAETPQYSSTPEMLGRQWSFGGLAGDGIKRLEVDADVEAQGYDLRGWRLTDRSPLRLGNGKKGLNH